MACKKALLYLKILSCLGREGVFDGAWRSDFLLSVCYITYRFNNGY